jgi:predicted metallopeptidase
MKWVEAPEVKKRLDYIISNLGLPHILSDQIFVLRSYGSTGRAIARIWSFPTVWQLVLKMKPHYVIEVVSERFDRQHPNDQDRTLIHELMHIPKTFSGALLAHHGAHRKANVTHKTVEVLYKEFLKNTGQESKGLFW